MASICCCPASRLTVLPDWPVSVRLCICKLNSASSSLAVLDNITFTAVLPLKCCPPEVKLAAPPPQLVASMHAMSAVNIRPLVHELEEGEKERREDAADNFMTPPHWNAVAQTDFKR